MKTPLIDPKKAALSSLVLASTLLFFCCSKDDSTRPSDGTSIEQTENRLYTTAGVKEVFKIEHLTGHGISPDYSVTVYSNRTAVFEGRRNVAFKGKAQFEIAGEPYLHMVHLFEISDFFSIKEDVPFIIDAPQIYTTWNVRGWSRTLHDFDNGTPQSLIQLRTRVEEMLNLSGYING